MIMKLITTDERLRKLIPHVLATVEGEQTLFEKMYPFLESAEEWVKIYFIPELLFDSIAEAADAAEAASAAFPATIFAITERIVACHAYMMAIPSLNLVMTPNGFGIVSNSNVVPASKERVERLIDSLETERDHAIEQLICHLAAHEDWRQSNQGKYFGATMFPFLGLCHRLAIKEHIWQEYEQLHDRLIKIETVLAETYFSHEQMAALRLHVMTQMQDCQPKQEQLIRSLQSLELLLVSDMQCHPQAF